VRWKTTTDDGFPRRSTERLVKNATREMNRRVAFAASAPMSAVRGADRHTPSSRLSGMTRSALRSPVPSRFAESTSAGDAREKASPATCAVYSGSPFLFLCFCRVDSDLTKSPQTRRLRGSSILNFSPSPEAPLCPSCRSTRVGTLAEEITAETLVPALLVLGLLPRREKELCTEQWDYSQQTE
jgi:hypothetical protein